MEFKKERQMAMELDKNSIEYRQICMAVTVKIEEATRNLLKRYKINNILDLLPKDFPAAISIFRLRICFHSAANFSLQEPCYGINSRDEIVKFRYGNFWVVGLLRM